jgi:hypothetical protein
MERRKSQGNTTPHKTNNLIEDLVGNEYLVADPSRMISVSNELCDVHNDMLKEDLKKDLIEIERKMKKQERETKK